MAFLEDTLAHRADAHERLAMTEALIARIHGLLGQAEPAPVGSISGDD